MNLDELKLRWLRDFGGPDGDYATFEEFEKQFQMGMESIGKELAKPQQSTEAEMGTVERLDKSDPVVGGSGENKG